eukprot:TRINITY_DN334_c0_g1_i5.p1 TRINITY_DN334_c0_g1~~TRINITY_DN334_c0_g1_i5.p1  ORF type:complete len:436 (+),score=163.58 TRINITY_DN334_c0_g1_i5:75-1310(+)
MPETRVPMTLRDHFLQDPFFNSSWSDMDKVRDHFAQQSQTMSRRFEDSWSKSESSMNADNRTNSSLVPASDSLMFRDFLMPRKWMMPKLFDDNFGSMLEMKDSNLISMKNDDTKMEMSLNTAGYKPSELKVNVSDGEISIEGKHEEKSEEGHTMVSRQFSKKYTLPAEAKLTEIVSNLSQDGVMVITVPKEKKIQEVKEEKKEKVEHKMLSANQEKAKASESLIPFTMRDSFFEDPFFKDNWMDIEKSQKNFFENSRKRFEESLKAMESSMISSSMFDNNTKSMNENALKMPDIFGKRSDSLFNSEDSNLIRIQDDETKLEISLDTTGYKPDELKVSAGQGMICVEGKHEEKSEAGQVMVARQFSKKYSLPASAKAEEVVSNLSQDGVLVISVPKREAIQQENRSVPIAVK